MFSNIAQITFSFPSFPFFLSFGRFFLKNLQTHHTQKAMVRHTNTEEKYLVDVVLVLVFVSWMQSFPLREMEF